MINVGINRLISATCLAFLCSLSPVFAVQIVNPAQCESVVVVEYTGWSARPENLNSITYLTPPRLDFRITDILAGPKIGPKITVAYEFCDADEQLSSWKFDESMLPKIGSKWILLIGRLRFSDPLVRTLDGGHGRFKFSKKILEKTKQTLAKRNSIDTGDDTFRPSWFCANDGMWYCL